MAHHINEDDRDDYAAFFHRHTSNGSLPITDEERQRFLRVAIHYQHVAMIDLLLAGCDANALFPGRDSPLFDALHIPSSTPILTDLLARGFHPDASDLYGRSPIYYAIDHQNYAQMESLIESGANLKHKDSFGQSPLHWAAHLTDSDMTQRITQTLLDRCTDSPLLIDHQGYSPLHYACVRGNHQQIQLLLEAGFDPNLQNRMGNTPAHELVVNLPPYYTFNPESHQLQSLFTLMDYQADLLTPDCYGRTVFDLLNEEEYLDLYRACQLEVCRREQEALTQYAETRLPKTPAVSSSRRMRM